MKKMMMGARMMIVAGAALLVALLPACRKSSPRPVPAAPAAPTVKAIAPGEFVTGEGRWEYESEEGLLTLSTKFMGGGMGWALQLSRKDMGDTVNLASRSDPWFVYLEGPRVVWVFDGKEKLSHSVLNADGSSTHGKMEGTSPLRFKPETKAPQAVLDRLPEEMRKLIPAAPAAPPAPKKVRPSI